MIKNVLFRCDASKKIGLGHITRCLALADELRDRGCMVYFAIKKSNIAIEKLNHNHFKFILAPKGYFDYQEWIAQIVQDKKIDIFIGDVRDGLPTEVIKTLKSDGVLSVVIDEPSEYAKECDLCFYPPHVKIDKTQYRGQVYQGLEYVLLRSEFYKKNKKIKNETPNVLVMMGGSDPYNLTLKIVKQLISSDKELQVSVILKREHKDFAKVKEVDKKVSVYSDINNMAEFLRGIDFGVISFGMSAYELLAMKIPAIHICLDDDHWGASEFFEKNGYAKKYKKNQIIFKKEIFDFQIIHVKRIKKNKILNKIIF